MSLPGTVDESVPSGGNERVPSGGNERVPSGCHHERSEGSAFPALSPHAVRLRNTALGTLSRRASRPAPTPTELEKIRDDLDLRDAWSWWSGQELPTQSVRAIRRAAVKRRPLWRATVLTLLASGAWLFVIR